MLDIILYLIICMAIIVIFLAMFYKFLSKMIGEENIKKIRRQLYVKFFEREEEKQ